MAGNYLLIYSALFFNNNLSVFKTSSSIFPEKILSRILIFSSDLMPGLSKKLLNSSLDSMLSLISKRSSIIFSELDTSGFPVSFNGFKHVIQNLFSDFRRWFVTSHNYKTDSSVCKAEQKTLISLRHKQ